MQVEIDWQRPDYVPVFRARLEALNRIRQNPGELPALKAFYKTNPAQFVSDWGCAVDPKAIALGLPATVPFVLFPKQVELVEWILARWKAGEPGLITKTRQGGVSWVTIALACTLCLFYPGMQIGFGSRKQELVDNLGDLKSLLAKGRMFMSHLPPELRGGWDIDRHAPLMRLMFPQTGAAIIGESGDQIGRGASTSMYFVDEAGFLEHPQLVENSLSETTDARFDISTPNGMANVFAAKRFSGRVHVFEYSWRDDPRKGEDWYRRQCERLDPLTLAQEVDADFQASSDGQVIASAWVQAAIDAHAKLRIEPTGARHAALDVADEGRDLCAFAGCHGILVELVEEWSGKGSDIYKTVLKAFALCDLHDYSRLRFDSDGLGAGVRGDAAKINAERAAAKRPQIPVDAFQGSAAVVGPEREDVPGRLNKDLFLNRKSQSWWALRRRFEYTNRVIVEGLRPFDPEQIISISSKVKNLSKLTSELSQPTWSVTTTGKILIDKSPSEGVRSPNMGDSVMIAFSTIRRPPMRISKEALDLFGATPRVFL
jgi:phage terminase large subunit